MPDNGVEVVVSDDGLVRLPAEFRDMIGLQPGRAAILRVADGELRLRPAEPPSLHDLFKPFLEANSMSVDEFIAEKREEAAREEEEFGDRGP